MRAKTLLWIILVSFLPITAYGQTQDDSQVQELYVKSGLENQLHQYPFIIQAAFEQASQVDDRVRRLPKNVLSAIKASAHEAFAPAGLKGAVLPELREKLTAQAIKELLDWLDSPLGKRCTQLEETASTPEGLTGMQEFASRMQASPPTVQRVDTLRKLDSAIKATESAVDVAINTEVAVAFAFVTALPSEQQRPLEDIARELERQRPNIEAMMRSQVLVSFLYTYRTLSDDEIERYIAFATSPVGSKYHSVTMAAVKKALIAGSIKWGRSVGDAIERLKKQSDT